jgi:hypothetical protein
VNLLLSGSIQNTWCWTVDSKNFCNLREICPLFPFVNEMEMRITTDQLKKMWGVYFSRHWLEPSSAYCASPDIYFFHWRRSNVLVSKNLCWVQMVCLSFLPSKVSFPSFLPSPLKVELDFFTLQVSNACLWDHVQLDFRDGTRQCMFRTYCHVL